jgi:hypothetical protein
MSSSTVLYHTANKHNTKIIFNMTAMLFYSVHKNTALQKLNSFQIYYSAVHNDETVMATLHVTELCYLDNVKKAQKTPPPLPYTSMIWYLNTVTVLVVM